MPFSFPCILDMGFYRLLESGILSPGPAQARCATNIDVDGWTHGKR